MSGTNPKDLLGQKKPQMGLIPVGALVSVARVMELGAKKYGPYNWRAKSVRFMVYANAALRHLFAWIGGETFDPESGEPHWAHVVACGLIVLDAMHVGNGIDDRDWAYDSYDGTPKDYVV
ncbi:MAG TPA: dATP/dGTP diphosphohydrolase domain-containing protein [Candidatus Paceibacterota bacterium]